MCSNQCVLNCNYICIHNCIDDDPLRRIIQPVQLQDVADSKAVQKWKPVCRRLGVSEDVIAQSDKTHVTDPSEAFYTSLASWKDEQGDEATLSRLIEALKDSGFHEVATKLI